MTHLKPEDLQQKVQHVVYSQSLQLHSQQILGPLVRKKGISLMELPEPTLGTSSHKRQEREKHIDGRREFKGQMNRDRRTESL